MGRFPLLVSIVFLLSLGSGNLSLIVLIDSPYLINK